MNELRASGFVAVNVSTVEMRGSLYWTGLFEEMSVRSWALETVAAEAFQATYDANVAARRISSYVHGFSTAWGPHTSPASGSIQWPEAPPRCMACEQRVRESLRVQSRRRTSDQGDDAYDAGGNVQHDAVWQGASTSTRR